jgi:uncharacterized membrane protein
VLLIESLESRRLFAAQYSLTLLPPTTSGYNTAAYAVNTAGQVVGYATNGTTYVPMSWSSAGSATQLPNSPSGDHIAIDVNDAGTILYSGYKRTAGGTFIPLSTPLPSNGGGGSAINSAGDVVGDTGKPLAATIWRANGTSTSLMPSSTAWDINDAGSFVGSFYSDAAGTRPYLYDSSGRHTLPAPTVGGTQYAEARAINNKNVIAGYSTSADGATFHQAVKWENGVYKELGALPGSGYSIALGINDAGDIVGYGNVAFVYHAGVMNNLNTLVSLPAGVKLDQAWDINNKGQIVGAAETPTGRRAFILTPLAATASISGAVFNDTDGDGHRDTGEPALANQRVYLDANKNGAFDTSERSALTNSAGDYIIKSLAGGSYRVRVVAPSGWRRTTPGSGYYDLTLAAGANATARNFGLTRNVLISGSVFNDIDRDKVRDANEGGLGAWRVFIDKDNDGKLDAGEPNVVTNSAGNFSFKALPAGTYTVRIVRPSGWTQTTPTANGGAFRITLAAGANSASLRFGVSRN